MGSMKIIIILLSLFFNFSTVLSQSEKKISFRVKVKITADYEIENSVKSYLKRELRDLGDIILTDQNPDWELSFIAIIGKTLSGYKSGIFMSMVALETYKPAAVDHLLTQWRINDKIKEDVKRLTIGLYSFSNHVVRIGSEQDIKSMCSSLIANFDTNNLEPRRKMYREIFDRINK